MSSSQTKFFKPPSPAEAKKNELILIIELIRQCRVMLFSYRLNEAIHDKEELLANNSVRPLSDSDLEELFLPLREKITELKEKIQIKLKFPFNLSKTAEDLALEENYYFSQLKQLVSTDEYEAFYTGITTCTDAHNPEYKFSPINKKIIHKLP